jgi:pantetheine-phosphate adenylyltransferase
VSGPDQDADRGGDAVASATERERRARRCAERRGGRATVRVTGGALAGRRLRVPATRGVRPTADRVREALFARLAGWDGARVLDLYAGSGSLGIEALSRGASYAVFVEGSAAVIATLRANLAALGLEPRARVVRGDVRRAIARLAREGERFDLVLVDPPYASGEAARALAALAGAGILTPGATLVVESSRRGELAAPPGLVVLDERRYGDTRITRFAGATGAAEQAGGSMQRTDARRVGLFAASFDPVTNGHLDLLTRARRVFDEVVVAVGRNISKEGTFSVEERLEILEALLGREAGVRITSFDGLVVDYAREIGATALIRGLRAMSDFEYEFEMALMNKHLNPELETLFMMTDQKYLYVSSSRLKELVRFGTSIEDFVPAVVAKKLREKAGCP